ncbi:carbon-nitrogen hydrolase family protein [Candidatus Woesearchaeota archaeon]|nr:carbon-nitrogen hydrolase family protein [Candidatus Woesearchaeota archaeon]
MKTFKVASAQLKLGKTVPTITKNIKRYLEEAKKKGVNIVCFPEYSLSAGPRKSEVILRKIAEECRRLDIWCILAGKLKEKKHVYNSAVLIDNHGKISGRHRKVHICDDPPIKAGTSFESFDTPFGKIGIAICWDIAYPESIYSIAKQGARLIFCPMFWEYDNWSHPRSHKKFEKKILESLKPIPPLVPLDPCLVESSPSIAIFPSFRSPG